VLSVQHEDKPGGPPVAGAVCIGVPLPGISAEVRDASGRVAGPGELGEIHLGGPGLMSRYWRNEAATAQAVTDGWLNSKDIGCTDAEGYLWIVDRREDLILRGGQNIYPAEVEQVLRDSPHVQQAAVVAAPSPAWGQTPVAYVQPRPGSPDRAELIDELIGLCVERLASYKRPSRFVIVDRIPCSPSGKILRRSLQDTD
jgi:acyl-CoA synthetase (AMP-forming)/AMP-acid ligase II